MEKAIDMRDGHGLRITQPIELGSTAVVMKATKIKDYRIVKYCALKCIARKYLDAPNAEEAEERWHSLESERKVLG